MRTVYVLLSDEEWHLKHAPVDHLGMRPSLRGWRGECCSVHLVYICRYVMTGTGLEGYV